MPRKKIAPVKRLLQKSVSDLTKNVESFFVDILVENTPEPLKDFVVSSLGAPRTGVEAIYRDKLAAKSKGKTEVQTPDGRIDILTKREVIEVKSAAAWKHALGQVLAYGKHYPSHQKRLHLYGELSKDKLAQIKQQCKLYDVTVTWEK